jgi:hypothetical protein
MPEEVGGDPDAIARAVVAGEDQIEVPEELLAERDESAPAPPVAGSLYARILTMGIAEKIKLALRGNKDARSILVRDTNKLIRRLVFQNPRVTDTEVIAIARTRTADEELLRIIADRKEWIRNYQVRLALATNPKTPLVLALKQVNTLAERDLRLIAKSKNVPAGVAGQARRLILNLQKK